MRSGYGLLTVLILMLVMAAGCKQPPFNTQVAGLRAGGDLGATGFLDSQDAAKVPMLQENILEVVEQLEKFMKTGNVSALTVGELRLELEKLVPVAYRQYVDQILAALSSVHVDTGAIGPKNVKRIHGLLKGLKTGLQSYDLEDRNVPLKEPTAALHQSDNETRISASTMDSYAALSGCNLGGWEGRNAPLKKPIDLVLLKA